MHTNPYQPPNEFSANGNEPQSRQLAFSLFDLIWPLAFAGNLIVPILFADSLTTQAGKTGMAVAIMMILISGWLLGRRLPNLARRMTTGAILVALSQLFPILHIFAGLIGLQITILTGGAEHGTDDDPLGQITSEWGGFLCTLFTGSALIVAACLIGWIVTVGYAGISKQLSSASPDSTANS